MKSRVTQNNKYQEKIASPKFNVRGVYIVRSLVFGLLVLNVALIYAILFSSHGLPGYKQQSMQVQELEEKILRLKEDNQKLFEMIQALKTSPKAQEKLVRQELGWVRENEIILEMPEKEGESNKPGAPLKPINIPQ